MALLKYFKKVENDSEKGDCMAKSPMLSSDGMKKVDKRKKGGPT